MKQMSSLLQRNTQNPTQQCVTHSKSVPQTSRTPSLSLLKSTEKKKGLTLSRAPNLWRSKLQKQKPKAGRWFRLSPTVSRVFILETDGWTMTVFYTSSVMVHHPDLSRALTSTSVEQLAELEKKWRRWFFCHLVEVSVKGGKDKKRRRQEKERTMAKKPKTVSSCS